MNTDAAPIAAENVTGRRIVAAIIDAIVVGVIFFVMTALFGDSESSDSGVSFNLSGVPFLVTLALTWAYYTILEAKNNGQTLGKLAMGVRVVSTDGSAIDFGKAAIRNVLRIVDNFPYILPLLGLILIAATGKHQRVGDMAASTVVVRA